jgi:hypothetical protein
MLLGEALHPLRGVLRIARIVVGHDRDHSDPALSQIEGVACNAVGDRAHVRTVVADKHDQRAGRPLHIGQPEGFAVGVLERELLCLPADGASGRLQSSHSGASSLRRSLCLLSPACFPNSLPEELLQPEVFGIIH